MPPVHNRRIGLRYDEESNGDSGPAKAVPGVPVAEHDEVMHFLSEKRLYGRGLGWIDLHLLASTALSRTRLWTTDRPLKHAAEQLGFHRLT